MADFTLDNDLTITPTLRLPADCLHYRFTRSSGPGGQNVNKVSTRVTVYFDVDACPAFSAAQRYRIRERLSTRINKAGQLYVTASADRSQAANRRAARERLAELIREALARRIQRRKTRTPPSAKRRRLQDKRRRSQTKNMRSDRGGHGD